MLPYPPPNLSLLALPAKVVLQRTMPTKGNGELKTTYQAIPEAISSSIHRRRATATAAIATLLRDQSHHNQNHLKRHHPAERVQVREQSRDEAV